MQVAQAFPKTRLTLIDFSVEMLAQARERFAGHPRVRFVTADYSKTELPGRYDAIVSALSIHHLEEPDKLALFGRIHAALRPGGIFINADQVQGRSEESHAAIVESWLRTVRANGVSETDLSAALERMQADRLSTLEAQLAGLEAAGFQSCECAYKRWFFAVYSGRMGV